MSARAILTSLLQIYLLSLFARLVLDYIRIFRPYWRPRGLVLAIADLIYRLTDPPLKFIGRFVPPLRIGAISFDMSFIVLYFFISIVLGRLVALLP